MSEGYGMVGFKMQPDYPPSCLAEWLAEYERKKWIPCSERMPEFNAKVLIHHPVWCQAELAWMGDGCWWMDDCGQLRLEEVTHWRPLPPGPEVPKP